MRHWVLSLLVIAGCNPTYESLLKTEAAWIAQFRQQMRKAAETVEAAPRVKASSSGCEPLAASTTSFVTLADIAQLGGKRRAPSDAITSAFMFKTPITMILSWTAPEGPNYVGRGRKLSERATDIVLQDFHDAKRTRTLVVVRPRTHVLSPREEPRFITPLDRDEEPSPAVRIDVFVLDVASANVLCSYPITYSNETPGEFHLIEMGEDRIIDTPTRDITRPLKKSFDEQTKATLGIVPKRW